ncbi:hypothetical protein HYFRA_00005807 [Hymenoscyphus fraxineus]|uniref:Uncharacterized protein n=1 Tax=Hymenoscyphus fraxineus TaxID=746836 RepID=A0A9N9PU60_9HELO|nr:hypothetical protein HYFRA_00005807 [Hymenoscyphus fraxineus]
MQFFNLSTGVLLLSAVLSTTALPTLTPNAIALQARDEVPEAKIIPRAGIWEALKSGWKEGLARGEAKHVKKVLLKAEKEYQARRLLKAEKEYQARRLLKAEKEYQARLLKKEKDYQARLAPGAVKNPAEKATKPTIHRRMWGALKNAWRVDRVRALALQWERYEAKREKEAKFKSVAAKSAAAQAAKITRRTPIWEGMVKGWKKGIDAVRKKKGVDAASKKKAADREALKAEQKAQAQRDRQEIEEEEAALKKWAAKTRKKEAYEAKMIQRHGSRAKWQEFEAEMKTNTEARKKAGLDKSDIHLTASRPRIQRRTPIWGGFVEGWKKGWKKGIDATRKKKAAHREALEAKQRARAQRDRQEEEPLFFSEKLAAKTAERGERDAYEAKMILGYGSNAKWQEFEARKKADLDKSDIHLTASPPRIQRRTPIWGGIVKGYKEAAAAREAARREKSYAEHMALRKAEAEAREKAKAEKMAAEAERKAAEKKAQEEADDADWAEHLAKQEADMIAKHGSKEAWEAQKIEDRKKINREIAADFAAKNRQREWAHNYYAEMHNPPGFRTQTEKNAYLDSLYKFHHPKVPESFYRKGSSAEQARKEAWRERRKTFERPPM